MTKRQIIQHAKHYMDMLSKGVDPISKKEVGPESIAMEPRLQKCFAFVSGILEELLANGGYVALPEDGPAALPDDSAPRYELVLKKAAFQLSQEQRRRVYIANAPISAYTFVNNINRVVQGNRLRSIADR